MPMDSPCRGLIAGVLAEEVVVNCSGQRGVAVGGADHAELAGIRASLPLCLIPAPETDPRPVRPLRDPVYKAGDFRVSCQGFDRVELALQVLVVDSGVYMRVAGTTQKRNPVLYIAAVEIALVAAIPVARLGNQVVTGEFPDLPLAQLACTPATYSAAVFHAVSLAQSLPEAAFTA